jgi:hypothetical protein
MKIDWKKELKFPPLKGLGRESGGSRRSMSRPSLGGPELHAPKILADLYADLRDRRLLPLVALLIVAIVAAPILLNKKGGGEEAPALTPAVAAGAEASDATFTVVPAQPGLRDYQKRLRHRTALNPFRRSPEKKQSKTTSGSTAGGTQTGPTSTGSANGSPEPTATIRIGDVTREVPASSVETVATETTKGESTSSESGPTEPTQVESTPAPEASAPPATQPHASTPPANTPPAAPSTEGKPSEGNESSKPSAPTTSQAVVGYTIDAEAGFVPHAAEKTELAPMTKLPNPKHPLVLFMGLSKDHKRALFLMTSNVTAYYGGHCALDKQSCQLVEVEPGKGITFADGYGETRYKVHLKRIVPVRHFSK